MVVSSAPYLNMGPIEVDLVNLVAGDPGGFTLTLTANSLPYTPASASLIVYQASSIAPVLTTAGWISEGSVTFDTTALAALTVAVPRYRIVINGATWLTGSADIRPVNSGRGMTSARTTYSLEEISGDTISIEVTAALFPEYDGAWNGIPLRMGAYYLWIDTSGRLRIKLGTPTSATDGTVVGTQT